MASMIPAVYGQRTPHSERKIFERLHRDPSCKDWTVFHSLGLSETAIGPHGEIDFVVLVPGYGIICMEIKGGEVSCTNGVWSTRNSRTGKTEKLSKSPYLQARENMFALRSQVIEKFGREHPLSQTPFSYVVVFPAAPRPPHTPEYDDAETIDIEDLRSPISGLIIRNIEICKKKVGRPVPGDSTSVNTLNALRKFLRPDFERLVTRSATIIESEEQLIELTEEQYRFLNVAEANQRTLITGAAGTGKTVLAMEYARREAMRGRRVLLLCFNKLLAGWIANELDDFEMIRVGTFHSIAKDIIRNSDYNTDYFEACEGASEPEIFGDLLPFYAELALTECEALCDTLIVDEAQDLTADNTLAMLNGLLVGGMDGGGLAIFGDFHRQAIYLPGENGDPIDDGTGADSNAAAVEILRSCSPGIMLVPLSVNCRNTRQIGEETALLSGFESLPYQLGKVSGLSVDYRYFDTKKNEREKLEAVLVKLNQDGVPGSDIVVLGMRRFDASAAAEVELNCVSWRVVDGRNDDPGDDRIPYYTIHAFKGLESPVVVITGITDIASTGGRSLLYVGMSRAKSHLAVILSRKTSSDVQERIRQKLSAGWAS